MPSFRGKVALVTGGGSGIGRATAIAFAREGASVVIADQHVESGQGTVRLVKEAGDHGLFVGADVSKAVDVEAMVGEAIAAFGRLDFAFNNAGVMEAGAPLVDLSEETWDRIMGINAKGVWMCMKYEIPAIQASGGGAIVNCSSVAGVTGCAGMSVYTASKHAVLGLTRSAALEYAGSGVRINAVCPGVIATRMVDEVVQRSGGDPKVLEPIRALHPIGRFGRVRQGKSGGSCQLKGTDHGNCSFAM
ncbi:MAG: SDR family oxidoreductase [Planctomycetaceae bacterium]|nr:SDR family oxidoreductase [Planctomycetaceae bacterium]